MPINNPPQSGAVIATGNYDGDNSANRAVAHGLIKTPKFVTIRSSDGMSAVILYHGGDSVLTCFDPTPVIISYTMTAMDATNFYVGNAANYTRSMNNGTGPVHYYWMAVG